jgi:hypothetical protein
MHVADFFYWKGWPSDEDSLLLLRVFRMKGNFYGCFFDLYRSCLWRLLSLRRAEVDAFMLGKGVLSSLVRQWVSQMDRRVDATNWRGEIKTEGLMVILSFCSCNSSVIESGFQVGPLQYSFRHVSHTAFFGEHNTIMCSCVSTCPHVWSM